MKYTVLTLSDHEIELSVHQKMTITFGNNINRLSLTVSFSHRGLGSIPHVSRELPLTKTNKTEKCLTVRLNTYIYLFSLQLFVGE